MQVLNDGQLTKMCSYSVKTCQSTHHQAKAAMMVEVRWEA